MPVTVLITGPHGFKMILPAPPIPDPQLVFSVDDPGNGGRALIRMTLSWAEIEQLHETLSGALHFRAPQHRGEPPFEIAPEA